MIPLLKFVRFIRFPMFLVPAGVFLAGMVLSIRGWPVGGSQWLAIAAFICLAGGTFSLNGYYDRFIDQRKGSSFAVNYPRTALGIALGWYVLGFIFTIVSSEDIFLIYILFVIGTVLYNRWLANIFIIKNFTAALLSASLVLAGGWAVGVVARPHWLWSVIIFGGISAMEIIKDMEDVKADQGFRVTIPMKLALPKVQWLVLALILLAVTVSLSLVPSTILFYAFWALTLLSFLRGWYVLPLVRDPGRARLARRWIYAGLWFGLLMMITSL